MTRGKILTFGPILLVAISYAIAAPSRAALNHQILPGPTTDPTEDGKTSEPLPVQCRTVAKTLRHRLDSHWKILIREPLILAGDFMDETLDELYERTIVPTLSALNESYFHTTPRHAISILICSSDERFRECNVRLEDQELSQYSGLYSRKHRRIIVNIASGEGTLAHELTHALAHADFPGMPEWFDEGLASLHEECEFSTDGLRLIGNSNWREKVASDALNQGELRLIEDVTSTRFGTNGRANLDYAHVRSLCLYLQDRGLLENFYATCRSQATHDPTGLRSLCDVARAPNPRSFDDAFRGWLMARHETTHSQPVMK